MDHQIEGYAHMHGLTLTDTAVKESVSGSVRAGRLLPSLASRAVDTLQ
jgi:hypothetical protein